MMKKSTLFLAHILTVLFLSSCYSVEQKPPTIFTPIPNLSPLPTSSPLATQVSVQDFPATDVNTPSSIQLCDEIPEPKLSISNNSNDDVFMSGTFFLCWYTEDSFDMDSGAVGHRDSFGNRDSAITDIELGVTKATIDGAINYDLQGINDAYITKSDMENPDIEYCREKTSAPTLNGGILLGNLDMVGCVLTNNGKLGFIKIDAIDPLGTESIEISFVTWAE